MLEAKIIRIGSIPWCSPAILVKKKDGIKRRCIDYRKLNLIPKIDKYTSPLIDELIDIV